MTAHSKTTNCYINTNTTKVDSNTQKITDLSNNVDLIQADLQNKINDSNIDGRDLNILVNGGKLKEIPIFIQSGDTQEEKTSLVVGIRTSKFKYYRSRKYPKENVCLYDLEKDPGQVNNIYNDPNYANVTAELKMKLKNLMIKFEDNKSLVDFRKITDTDFGRIVDDIKDEESVQQILTKKKN